MKFLPQFELPHKEDTSEGLWLLYSQGESQLACPADIEENPVSSNVFMESKEAFFSSIELQISPVFRLGEWKGKAVFGGVLPENFVLPEGWKWFSFFQIFRETEGEIQFPLSRAKQILSWERTHRFCGSCGGKTELVGHEPCRKCPSCGHLSYPPIAPAVIILICRGDQLLLAHNKNFPDELYSNIAGFVDAGETLEQAVHREIDEEVSLKVEDVRYYGSQPWPMPHSLMVGFIAECPQGEPIPDGVEIEDAQWFGRENLPLLPPKGSIARRMIDDFFYER